MEPVLGLIDDIYESVLDAGKWSNVLERATTYFGARGAQIGNTDLVNSRLSFSLLHGYDWSVDHMLRYESLMGEDPRLPHFSANPFKPVHCRMALSDEELRGSRVYKEVLSVGGVEYSLGVNFADDDRALSYFLVLRDATMPPFTHDDCDKMAVLVPHLARALRLQRELDTLAFDNQAGFGALDSMAVGVVITDEGGRVRFVNAMAERLLARADGLRVVDGRLHGVDEEGADLARLIGGVHGTGRAEAHGASRPLRVRRAGDASPYLVVLSTLPTASARPAWRVDGEKSVVLFIRDPDHAQETRVELLRRLYGLTGSEARLTDIIASGVPLKSAARSLGLTEATARQYIKQVFRKTGVSGQPALVHKVMNLPPSISAGPSRSGATTPTRQQ
jgi:DNA-binding CsgD family transcriptional regulator